VIHEALGGNRRADALVDESHDLDDPLAAVDVALDAVADAHRRRRLGSAPVHAYVAATARVGRQ
jgi:hypothetical protein